MRHSVFTVGLVVVLALSGCQPIIGSLQVRQDLPIQATQSVTNHQAGCTFGRDSDCEPKQLKVLETYLTPGNYPTELLLDDESVRLTLKQGDGSKLLLELPIPPGTNVPQAAGRFQLASAATGQGFDLHGDVSTNYGRSQSQSGWETCQRQVLRTFCGYGKKGHCQHHYVTVYGERPVTYHFDIETKSVLLTLNEPIDARRLASFSGSQTLRNKSYEFAGYCQFYGHYPFAGHYY